MMQRRDFLTVAGLMASVAGLSRFTPAGAVTPPLAAPLDPFLLPALPPLDHQGGMDIRVWVRNHMTGGVFSCVECAVAPKTMGPPPHWHRELDELMFVLDGTASVLVGTEVVEVAAGGWHFRPRQIRHTFFNASDKPVRFIDMYFNQPFEEFLEKVFFEYTPEKGYPFGSPQRQEVTDALNAQFGLVFAPTADAERQALIKEYGLM